MLDLFCRLVFVRKGLLYENIQTLCSNANTKYAIDLIFEKHLAYTMISQLHDTLDVHFIPWPLSPAIW